MNSDRKRSRRPDPIEIARQDLRYLPEDVVSKKSGWQQRYGSELFIAMLSGTALLFLLLPRLASTPLPSDLRWIAWAAGASLGLVAVVMAGVRFRRRVLSHKGFWDRACPRCSSPNLRRIHRSPLHRLIDRLGFPVRRFMCAECQWRGLRISERRSWWGS